MGKKRRFRGNPIAPDTGHETVAGVFAILGGAVTIVRRVVAVIVLVGRMNIDYQQGNV